MPAKCDHAVDPRDVPDADCEHYLSILDTCVNYRLRRQGIGIALIPQTVKQLTGGIHAFQGISDPADADAIIAPSRLIGKAQHLLAVA
jgi:hypothetical protein